MTNWQIAAGRGISPEDDSQAALVVVLGQTVHRQLFGSLQNQIGAVVQVKGVPLRVVGVLAPKGQTPFGTDQDDLVMIPFTTAERKVLGVAAPSQQQTAINWILSRCAKPLRSAAASRRLRQPDLRSGREPDGGPTGDPPSDRNPCTPAPHQAR